MKISDLQNKDIVNVADGRKLGRINDIELDLTTGRIKRLLVPSETKLFGLFSSGQDWVIPWNQIVKIGSDVILVKLEQGLGDTNLIEKYSGKSGKWEIGSEK